MNEYAEQNVAEETAATGISEQGEINAADLFAPEANGAGVQTDRDAQTDAPVEQKPDDRRFTSDDMSRAVQNRLKQERRGAAYQLGRELLDEYMRANNLSESDALAKIREDRIKQKAAEFKADPEKGFTELMRQREQRIEPEEETRTSEARAETLYNNIVSDMQAGKVPQGFDLRAYMTNRENAQQFIELYEAFGMEKACAYAIRMAPQPTRTEINRSLPQGITTNNSYSPNIPDVANMDSKTFREFDQKMKQAYSSGKRVKF